MREYLYLIISDIRKYRYKNNSCKKQGEKGVFGRSKEGKKKVGLRQRFNKYLTNGRHFYTLPMAARNDVKTAKELSGNYSLLLKTSMLLCIWYNRGTIN